MFSAAIRWGVVCSLALAGAAPGQCQKGGGGQPRMMGGMRGPGLCQPRMTGIGPRPGSPGRQMTGGPPQNPGLMGGVPQNPGLVGGLPQNPGLSTVPTLPRLLTGSQELQQSLTELITQLRDLADDPGLSPTQQRKLRAALTTASKKSERQEDLLAAIAMRQGKGLLVGSDQARLVAIVQQQQALLQALEGYRVGAAKAVMRPKLAANQPR